MFDWLYNISRTGVNIHFDMARYAYQKPNLHFDGLVCVSSNFSWIHSPLISAVQKAIFDPSIYNLLINNNRTNRRTMQTLQISSFSFHFSVSNVCPMKTELVQKSNRFTNFNAIMILIIIMVQILLHAEYYLHRVPKTMQVNIYFSIQTKDRTLCPTLCKSYHQLNSIQT